MYKELEEAKQAHHNAGPFKNAAEAINSPTFSKIHKAIKHMKNENREKKQNMAKKMRPIGEDMHRTFKKLGTAVSKLGSTHKKYGDKPF